MSVILCRQKAKMPFCHDKLNINIWSEQELSYIVYNYPLLCLEDFLNESLFEWIENGLQMKQTASVLRSWKRAGETPESMLIYILKECNYYDADEIYTLAGRISELKKCSMHEYLRMEGDALFSAGKFSMASDKYEQAVKCIDAELRKPLEDDGELKEQKAGLFCDLAGCRLRMFDENGALDLLVRSELVCHNKRAVRMRYLINGAGDLKDEEKEELDSQKAEAVERARNSENYKKIEAMFENDDIRLLREAAAVVKDWKNRYRHM